MIVLILLICALFCFILGAVGAAARISWDQAGKAFLTAALIASQAI